MAPDALQQEETTAYDLTVAAICTASTESMGYRLLCVRDELGISHIRPHTVVQARQAMSRFLFEIERHGHDAMMCQGLELLAIDAARYAGYQRAVDDHSADTT